MVLASGALAVAFLVWGVIDTGSLSPVPVALLGAAFWRLVRFREVSDFARDMPDPLGGRTRACHVGEAFDVSRFLRAYLKRSVPVYVGLFVLGTFGVVAASLPAAFFAGAFGGDALICAAELRRVRRWEARAQGALFQDYPMRGTEYFVARFADGIRD